MRWDKVPIRDLEREIAKGNGSLHLMTSFLALLPVPAFVKDKKGRILFLNQPAEKLWGLKSRDAVGKTKAELFYARQLEKDVRSNDLLVLRHNAARVFVHLDPRYGVLKFPFVDSEGDRLIGGILVDTSGKDIG